MQISLEISIILHYSAKVHNFIVRIQWKYTGPILIYVNAHSYNYMYSVNIQRPIARKSSEINQIIWNAAFKGILHKNVECVWATKPKINQKQNLFLL